MLLLTGPTLGHRMTAEATGTFFLVLIGPGAAAVNQFTHGAVSHVGVALAFAFVLIAGIYALGHISGAHFNPAVTIAFALRKGFPGREVLPYIASQLMGALAAGALLALILGDAAIASATVPTVPVWGALLLEAVLTLFLMLVVTAVATDARVAGPIAGLAVGLAVGADALMGGPLTGASMNPARSFGPALATGVWDQHWIYWLGPFSGAIAGVLLYDYLRKGTAHDHRH